MTTQRQMTWDELAHENSQLRAQAARVEALEKEVNDLHGDVSTMAITIETLQTAVNEAREVIEAYRGLPIGPKGYTSMPLFQLHNDADVWLAAHAPAPKQEQEA